MKVTSEGLINQLHVNSTACISLGKIHVSSNSCEQGLWKFIRSGCIMAQARANQSCQDNQQLFSATVRLSLLLILFFKNSFFLQEKKNRVTPERGSPDRQTCAGYSETKLFPYSWIEECGMITRQKKPKKTSTEMANCSAWPEPCHKTEHVCLQPCKG